MTAPDLPEKLMHILRPPLPWRRDGDATECGRPTNDVPDVMDRADAKRLADKLGRKRMHMVCCVTCIETAERHWTANWETAPRLVMARWIGMNSGVPTDKRGALIDAELTAIGLLVEAHRDEFEDTLSALAGTVSLADARSAARWRRGQR